MHSYNVTHTFLTMRNPWTLAGMAKDLTWLTDEPFSISMLDRMTRMFGSPGALTYLGSHLHAQTGRQLQIDPGVSRDLMLTDFAASAQFADVPWPAPSVELYFEDVSIPTALVQYHDAERLSRMFPGLAFANQDPRFVVIMETGAREDRQVCCLNLRADHWNRVLRGERLRMADSGLLPTLPLDETEDAALVQMARLALKVFAYVSIFPAEDLTRGGMHHGGKPGVRSRPKRPAFRVRYFTAASRSTGARAPGHRAFNGRRGHFRHFQHERYVNMNGKWIYVSPVPGPDGTVPEVPVYKVA